MNGLVWEHVSWLRSRRAHSGTLLGALPKIPTGAKQGLCTAIALHVVVLRTVRFVRHAVERLDRPAHPVLSLLNPAQQITNLFYDILYYDNFKPFFTTAGILAAMSLVCLARRPFC